MRRTAIAALLVGGLLVTACGDDDDADSTDSGTDGAACAEGKTLTPDVLTIATGEPTFRPWVDRRRTRIGPRGSRPPSPTPWPARWASPRTRSRGCARRSTRRSSPGPRTSTSTCSSTRSRRSAPRTSSFSDPYYTSNQAIVAFDDSPAEGATTVADLKDVKFGAQAGTTSLAFITDVIKPDTEPFVYDDNVGAKAALEANQIDAIVVDLPTAFFIAGGRDRGQQGRRPVPAPTAGGTTDDFGLRVREGQSARRVRQRGAGRDARTRASWTTITDRSGCRPSNVAPVIAVG